MSIYLELDGVPGNVSGQGLEKHIQVRAVSQKIARKFNTQPGVNTDREGSKPYIEDLTFEKVVDETSPQFLTLATNPGNTIASATFKFVTTNKNLDEYYQIKLSNVFVSSYEFTDQVPSEEAGAEDAQLKAKPMERIKLNFDKIEVTFIPRDNQDNQGSPIRSGYNLQTATGC